MVREASAEFEKTSASLGHMPLGLWALGRGQALSGRRDEALRTVEEMKALSAQWYVSPAYVAMVLHHLGDKDQIFKWWDKACEDRSYDVLFLKVDPENDVLRDDSRFAALLRKANLSP